MSLGSGIRDPGSGIRNKPIPDPGSRIPDPGVKKAPIPDPGSRIRIRDTQVPLPKHQMSGGFFAFFEKIYHGQPNLTVFSNIGEDIQ
jgi:hypothetical protein